MNNNPLLQKIQQADKTQKITYYRNTNCLSNMFYSWIHPLISYGNKNEIQQQNLQQLRPQQKAQAVYEIWIQIWRQTKNTQNKNPLWQSIWNSFKSAFFWAFFLDFLQSTFIMSTPLVIRFILQYLQGDAGQQKIWKGFIYIFIMITVRFCRSFFSAHAGFAFTKLGQNLSSAMTLGIVDKSMRFSILCNKRYKIGELVNMLQVDALRLTIFPKALSSMMMLPYQLLYGIALMAWTIQYSFLGGFGVIIIITIMNTLISKFTSRYQKQSMNATDNRMKATNQLYNAIKFVKVNAWQEYFYDRLDYRRNIEIDYMRKKFISESFSVFSMWLAPKMILAVTFTIYTLTGNILTPVTAFTTQAVFAFLQFTMQAFPLAISTVIESRFSLKRIENYLKCQQIDRTFITHQIYDINNQKYSIQLNNGNFYWDKNDVIDDQLKLPVNKADKDLDLIDVKLQIKKGQFVSFIGDIGCGKSSLLYSLLGEMKYPANKPRPQLKINGKIALVTQKPWIINATVRQNITFGMQYDIRKYEQVIHYANLKRDFELFTHGDQTMIGQKGATLSGGQKARISFARALYSEAEILFLDDLLSAVDVHVGKFLIKEALLKYCAKKTRLLVTHALYYLKYLDKVCIIQNGAIVESGDYQKISSTQRFGKMYQNLNKGSQLHKTSTIIKKQQIIKRENQQQSQPQQPQQIDRSRVSMAKTDYAADIPIQKKQIQNKKSESAMNELMMSQDKAVGDISWSIYYQYYKWNGGFCFIFMLLLSKGLWQVANIMFNVWLSFWTEDKFDQTTGFYLGIYYSLGFLYGFFAFTRALTFAFSNTYMSKHIHQTMQLNLLFSSLNEFFDRVPLGRILNRLSKDLNTVDTSFPNTLGNFLSFLFFFIGNVLMCIYCSSLWVIFPILIYIVACYLLKNYYMKPNRACVRLQSITKSPIISCFTQILNGLATIRAYNVQSPFFLKSCYNSNENIRPAMARKAIEVWFTLRLTFLSFIINAGSLAFIIFQKNPDEQTVAKAGLLLISAIAIDELTFMTIFYLGLFQNDLISFERCQTFMKLQPQRGYKDYVQFRDQLKQQKKRLRKNKMANQWPDKGKIEFINLYVKYRANLDCVLRGLTVTFKPGQKIGVVGRTGSGKSTIMMTLLRILQAYSGQILIDGQDISNKSLDDLRARITIILQDPYMFAGTLRQNLDPLGEFSDAQLNLALQRCALRAIMAEREGLNTEITQNGQNLSVGQRQLISIARATLRNSKIVLIDQATANIDVKTEGIIQSAMTNAFKVSTVITIAHRLNTVINSDRILVLEGGQVKEFDSPKSLLSDENSFFAGLWNQSQKESKM